MDWARILAFVTGMVDQELLARNEYLAADSFERHPVRMKVSAEPIRRMVFTQPRPEADPPA
jgi:hypothetical protein